MTTLSGARKLVLLLSGRGLPVTYLLRDEFTTTEAAPITSPRTAEPGPGTLTVVDTENKVSIVGGALTFAGGKAVPSVGDPGVSEGPLAWTTGRAMLTAFSTVAGSGLAIWYWAGSGFSTTVRYTVGTGFQNSSSQLLSAAATGIEYQLALVLDAAHCHFCVRGGVFTDWTLLWVFPKLTSADQGAYVTSYNLAYTAPYFRIADLPVPWATDYGIATRRLAGARSAGDTFTHTANCLLEWTQTTISSALQTEVRFRMQDATNYWQVTVDSSGNLDLDEVVAGTPTQRATAAGVVANGDRIVVVADGSTIRVYEANMLRITYSSASNFATATAGELETEGTGGAVSDIISWPRVLTGAAASALTRASV